MNRTGLQLRRWMGPSRCRHDAEWQLATIDRRQAATRLDAAVRTLEARGDDVARAIRAKNAAERSLDHLVRSTVDAAGADHHTPIAVASDLLAGADHDLRVAQDHRAAAAEQVAQQRRALQTAIDAERRALTVCRSTGVLVGAGGY